MSHQTWMASYVHKCVAQCVCIKKRKTDSVLDIISTSHRESLPHSQIALHRYRTKPNKKLPLKLRSLEIVRSLCMCWMVGWVLMSICIMSLQMRSTIRRTFMLDGRISFQLTRTHTTRSTSPIRNSVCARTMRIRACSSSSLCPTATAAAALTLICKQLHAVGRAVVVMCCYPVESFSKPTQTYERHPFLNLSHVARMMPPHKTHTHR